MRDLIDRDLHYLLTLKNEVYMCKLKKNMNIYIE